MQKIRTTKQKYPDRVTRKLLFDSDRLKPKVKELAERIEDIKEVTEILAERIVGGIFDIKV